MQNDTFKSFQGSVSQTRAVEAIEICNINKSFLYILTTSARMQ